MRIEWDELESAFTFSSDLNPAYLQVETGEILWLSDSMLTMEREELEERIENEEFSAIEVPSSHEKWNWMAAFIETVQSVHLRELLEVAIQGKGAFRRFKDVLRSAPEEEKRWFRYEQEQMRSAIERWVAELGVQVDNPPPWSAHAEDSSPISTAAELSDSPT